MATIILGKNLLSTEELIEFAFSDLNTQNQALDELTQSAQDAAIHSSLLLIRMMRAERIFIDPAAETRNRTL
ncbi:hypothetical protein QWZ13_09370 [Reinekea marina]|uniref:Uncharacterized protein n=1 Tax=Reinekea marina TaxID=1310421 RepID=A0ABV7WS60_9GAMM|nr:hypothetical protein [Reinekea marina]MBU2862860.1 hypothetical protein [Reinekea forsetii]MDN3649118.1 hypothetical protein [Reinekea marina]